MSAPVPSEKSPRGAMVQQAVSVQSFRRWLAGVTLIAVVAGALAVYALLSGDEAADGGRVTALERRISQLEEAQRRQQSVVEGFERRLSQTGRAAEVAALDRRVRRIEGALTDAVDGVADATEGLSKLDDRVDALARRRR